MTAADRAGALRRRAEPVQKEPVSPPPVRTKPVRQTVDLSPEQHTALATWRLETALALGRTRLTTQDVLAAAVSVLVDDEVVARRIRARLEL